MTELFRSGLLMSKKRRENCVFFIIFSVVFALFCRICFLQIFSFRFLQKKAEKEHLALVKFPAFRGAILDRKGRLLAVSLPAESLYVSPKFIQEPEKTADILSKYLGEEKSGLLKKMGRNENFVWIKRQLNREDYEKIEELHLPGVGFCEEFKRVYPKGILASHILGFADIDGKGLSGAERENDALLKGESGWYLLIKDAKRRVIPSLERKSKEGSQGLDLILAIDEKIQEITEEELEKVYQEFHASAATAIVMDPFTGEILGLANRPTFDPNSPGSFSPSFLRNRAITDLFEPGSVFKTVTAAAALEEGIIKPIDRIFCENGKWLYRNHFLHDHEPYKNLSFQEVIAESSNIGTAKVALKLGEEDLYRYACSFGFGEKTGIDLPGEIKGILRPLNKWSKYSIIALPIGQEIGATPIQNICALAVIANGGKYVKPYLLKEVRNSEGMVVRQTRTESKQIISVKTALTLTSILKDVVKKEGTAFSANVYGYSVAGKTGTAQKIVAGRYSHSKFVASFIGYGPADNPKIIVLVMLDEPKSLYYGGLVAAPAFKEITRRVLAYLEVPSENLVATNENLITENTKKKYSHE